ncbi:MAG: hypothetical protein SV775_09420 [Thermodesulfobacteriota bacterium]|nr:hypothetical protein [Thermodesulfobacteriota bacterium]
MQFKRIFLALAVLAVTAITLMIAILVVLAVFGLESDPLVLPQKKLALEDVRRIKQVLKENNPRRLKAGEIKELSVSERDVNLVLFYVLSHSPFRKTLTTHVYLNQNSANALFTYVMPANPFGAYLNVSAYLHQSIDSIDVDKLRIGSVALPGWVVDLILKFALNYLQQHEKFNSVIECLQSIRSIDFDEDNVVVVYQWRPEIVDQIKDQGKSLLLPDSEAEKLLIYTAQLAMISRNVDGNSASLTRFFQPLFKMALHRTNSGGDPIAENRALILALTIYGMGRTPDRIVGNRGLKEVERPRPVANVTLKENSGRDKSFRPAEVKETRRPRRVLNLTLLDRKEKGKASGSDVGKSNKIPRRIKLSLLNRGDLALHFMVSAAITVSAGGGMADLLGLFKEMSDSQGGSGFSFADLAADRAGVRLAEKSMRSPVHAEALQRQMGRTLNEADFMPRVDSLPEGIMELEFKSRYRDLDSAAYRMVDDEISRRIAECSIYE